MLKFKFYTYLFFVDMSREVVAKFAVIADKRGVGKIFKSARLTRELDLLEINGWVDVSADFLNLDGRLGELARLLGDLEDGELDELIRIGEMELLADAIGHVLDITELAEAQGA